MEFKLICVGLGFTAITFNRGYVSLLEELIQNGKRYNLTGTQFLIFSGFFNKICISVVIKNEEAFLTLPFYESDFKLTASLKSIFIIDFEKFRFAAGLEVINMQADQGVFKIYAELVLPGRFLEKLKLLETAGTQCDVNDEFQINVALNVFLINETVIIYADKDDYFNKKGAKSVIDEKTIVWLKNVNTDETANNEIAYAHFTGVVKSAYKVLNEYTNEYFRRIVVCSNGIEFNVISPYSLKKELDPLKELKKDCILEGDGYFTAKQY